ncbi:hypothetical protein [Halococcus sp. PRR34]|nr:hypothetical protein [Halococcus sp. PRR34]
MASEQPDSDQEETTELESDPEESIQETTSTSNSKPKLGPDEVYCTSCGATIKNQAEVCPECGVRQTTDERQTGKQKQGSSIEISDRRQYELEKMASKDITTTMLWGLFLTPIGYLKVGKTGLAVLNFLTFNYILLGFVIVPLHTRKMIKDAREELRRAGVAGY